MTYIISITQTKGGATKTTTSVNLLGALIEAGYKTILCDMDKDKPDSLFWADLGTTLNDSVIPLYDENPKPSLNKLKKDYDFILIDTPPNMQAASLKATILSDFVIIPCSVSELDKNALNQAASSAMMANKPYSFLASRVTKNTLSTKSLLSELMETGYYFNANITNSVDMIECQKSGQWVGSYKPNCQNHQQYKNLIRELLEKISTIEPSSNNI
jgi:chromosome partitioning protein